MTLSIARILRILFRASYSVFMVAKIKVLIVSLGFFKGFCQSLNTIEDMTPLKTLDVTGG